MLPDGLADVDLVQSKLPLENILACKAALKSTALAYSDEHKRLHVLIPIREYLQQYQPPGDLLIQCLFEYFEKILIFYSEYSGTQSGSSIVTRIKSNYTNIQNVLQWGLKQEQPILSNSIYCVCYLSHFCNLNLQTPTPLMGQIYDLLPQLKDHRLKAYVATDLFSLWDCYPISNPEGLASQTLEYFQDFDDPDLQCMLCDQSYL
jgi:hypothetical protein